MPLFINPGHLTDVSSYCQFDLLSKQQTDVTFIAKDNRSLTAHKIVLSSLGCFMKLLCKESNTILLPEVDYEAVAAFLCLLYTGESVLNGPGQVREFTELMGMLCISLPDCVKEQMVARCDVGQIESKDVFHELQEKIPAHKNTHDDLMDAGPSQMLSECSPAGSTEDWTNENAQTFVEVVYAQSKSPVSQLETPEFLNCNGTIKVEEIESADNVDDPFKMDSNHSGGSEMSVSLLAYHLNRPEPSRSLPTQNFEWRFRCKYCMKGFLDRHNHSAHLRTHVGDHPYTCLHCQKKFKLQSQLTDHLRLGTAKDAYPCPECHRSFKYKCHLDEHFQLHSGVRRHACEFCYRTFYKKHNLTSHLKMHSEERPYPCNQCEMKFKFMSHLKRHLNSHVHQHPHENL